MIPTLGNFEKYLQKEKDLLEWELINRNHIHNEIERSEFQGRYKQTVKIMRDLLNKEEDTIF